MIEISSSTRFDFNLEDYKVLFQRSNASAFQHPEWLMAFYNHLIKENHKEALVISGHSMETGELMAVIPLVRNHISNCVIVEFAFGGVSDYSCAVVHPDLCSYLEQTPSLTEQLINALGYHDILRIEPVRDCDLMLWQTLLGITAEKLEFGRHSVQYGENYSQWRSDNLSVKRRSQLDRKKRRLADQGKLNFRLLSTEEVGHALIRASHLRKGRYSDDPIQQKEVLDFYRGVAEAGAKSGFSRTYLLSCDGNFVALCFGLVHQSRYCYLVLACDYETYGQYSPGIIILDMAMADWCAEGGKVFDFTIGDEPFKKTFGCDRSPMYRFTSINTELGRCYLQPA